jgi:NADH dehydrogenase (ubiquinone) 1 beta subcomplex subunit 3
MLTFYSETWRYTGPFSRFNRFKGLFPGFGIATVAFTAYCAYEHFFMKDDHHHGDSHHGEAHH